MKGVILAAGFGTRMLPITKTIPKELLPVGKKPVIQYVVEAFSHVKIKDLVIVTSQGKVSLEDYFDKNYELEEILIKKGKQELLKKINMPKKIANIAFVKQKQQLGTGHALALVEPWIDTDYFLMSRGDHVFDSRMFEEVINTFKKYKKPVIGLTKVPREDVHKYGVVRIENDKIIEIVEKPKKGEAPSNFMLNGLYVFPKEIFKYLKKIKMNERLKEILLPDAVELMMKDFDVIPCVSEYSFLDIGNPRSRFEANKQYFENNGNLFS